MWSVPEKLEVLLLAAGSSQRMGDANKLLLPFRGRPLIRHVAEQVLGADIGAITVITGHGAPEVSAALSGLPLTIAHNPDFAAGQMASVRHGFQLLARKNADTMVALGDMPLLKQADYRALFKAFRRQNGDKILIPFFNGERGNPIILPKRFAAEIASGALNAGCRRLTEKRPQDIRPLAVPSSAYVVDVDTPSEYETVIMAQMAVASCCG